MGSSMTTGGGHLLPEWLRLVWVAIYAVIVIVHLRHAVVMGGQLRAWHTGHILMALGMSWMFLPGGIITLPTTVGEVVFALSALAISCWVIGTTASRRRLDFLWLILLLDMLGMVYMFAFPQVAFAPLTYLCTIYFATEMGSWLVRIFDRLDRQQWVLPSFAGVATRVLKTDARPLVEANSIEMCITLGLMAAGMAYMFLAMQAGM